MSADDIDITIEDIADLRPRCYGCDSNNTRVIHPSAGFNDSGQFLIQCGNCGRVRTVRAEHVREMLAEARGRTEDEQDATVYFQVSIHYRSHDYQGFVHSTYLFEERAKAQQEADTLVDRYEIKFGWASAQVLPVRLVKD